MGQKIMAIRLGTSHKLMENQSYLKQKIQAVGYEALAHLLHMQEDPTVSRRGKGSLCEVTADRLRFLAECWLDENCDVISKTTRERFLERQGCGGWRVEPVPLDVCTDDEPLDVIDDEEYRALAKPVYSSKFIDEDEVMVAELDFEK